jgi:NitT/TauT family transport system permease protein
MTSTIQLPKPALRLKLPLPLLGLGIASLIWWLWTTPLWHSDPTLADFSPERTFAALVLLFSKGTIIPHILTSLRRVFVGLVVAIAVGVPLGMYPAP